MQSNDLAAYYAARASEYDAVYEKPERQADLAELHLVMQRSLSGRRVLEVACGTGYWTARYAPVAAFVLATDINPNLVAHARARVGSSERVVYAVADASAPPIRHGGVDACVAAFWWSHLDRREVRQFLLTLHRAVVPGTRLLFVDNRFVEGSSTPIARVDGAGNRYQRRALADGRSFEILKNFPTGDEVRGEIARSGSVEVVVRELRYYWYATYVVGPV